MLGAAFFGYCLDIFLYGILTVQTYVYYLAFPHDKRVIKTVVYFVFIVGTLQSAVILHDFYILYCTLDGSRWLDGKDIHRFGFMWLVLPVCESLITTAVHMLYTHRIYTINAGRLSAAVVAMLASLKFLTSIISAGLVHGPVDLNSISEFPTFNESWFILLSVGIVLEATCDILIAIYMASFVCTISILYHLLDLLL